MATTYSYSITTDFLAASDVNTADLQIEVEGSAIASATVQYVTRLDDDVDFVFDGALSGGDQTTLTGLVNAYTFSADTDDFVLTETSATLSNKDLVTDTNFFIDPVDATKRLGFDASSSTTSTTLTLSASTTANRTVSIPDATDTVALLTASQTLTNKSLTSPTVTGTLTYSTGAVNGHILQSDGSGNATWVAPSSGGNITYYESTSSNSFQTNSTTYVNIPNMELTVVEAGTYNIIFNSNFNISSNNRTTSFDLSSNGTTIANSEQNRVINHKKSDFAVIVRIVHTFSASDVLRARVKNSVGNYFTELNDYRSIFAIKLA